MVALDIKPGAAGPGRKRGAFATVLDPASLIQGVADLATAEAAAAGALRRAALHCAGGGVSADDMQATKGEACSAALRAELLRRWITAQWGLGVGHLNPKTRERLVQRLAEGCITLVKVEGHDDEGLGSSKFVRIDTDNHSALGVVLGRAQSSDRTPRLDGLIVGVTERPAALGSVGRPQNARIETIGV